jgi:hypothetical protein
MQARLHYLFPEKKALLRLQVRAGGKRRLESHAPKKSLSQPVCSRHIDHERVVARFRGIRLQSGQHGAPDASVRHSTIDTHELGDAEIEPFERTTTDSFTLPGSSNEKAPSGGAYVTVREARLFASAQI